jgi:transcriptional regulator with XRE-family HTH domain
MFVSFQEVKGLTLDALRKAADKTQQQVAEACNVSQAAVSRWESGEYPIPRKYWKFFRALYRVTDDELNKAINKTMEEANRKCT